MTINISFPEKLFDWLKDTSVFLLFSFIGVLFSIIFLIIDRHYFIYGFSTFLYGIWAHILDLAFRHINFKYKYEILFLLQFVSFGVWILILFCFYK